MLTGLGLLLVLELISYTGLWVVEGAGFTPMEAALERRQARARAGELANPSAEAAEAGENPFSTKGQVIHPYLGYVLDPDRRDLEWPVERLGFFATPAPAGSGEAPLRIAVFGGSVANLFVRYGREHLVELLRAVEPFSTRPIWVQSFAMGGYKQPQQLQALGYLLAIGERPDIVLNLDGFNDIATAPEEYVSSGLSPWYPRGWPTRLVGLPETESLRLVGELAFLEGRRAGRGKLCDRRPLAWSPTCHLLWSLRDQRTSLRLQQLREALAAQQAEKGSFATLGPPWMGESREEMWTALAEAWERSSHLMHEMSEARGLRYFHFLQPNQYVPDSKPMGRRERRLAFDRTSPRGESVRRAYPMLAALGEGLVGKGVRFHDLRMIFAGIREPLYEDRCCHLNLRGNEILAEEIARRILADYGD